MPVRAIIKPAIYREKQFSCACRAFNWFTDIFTEDLGTEGERKIKYITSTQHLVKKWYVTFSIIVKLQK